MLGINNILDEINHTAQPYDNRKTVLDLFVECVTLYPDNTAVIFEGRRYTYRQVDEITTRLACRIIREGGVKGGTACVLVPRCEYMPMVPLACFKAGMTYVPLDYTYPSKRLKYILKNSESQLLIATPEVLPLCSCSCQKIVLPQPENSSDILTWDADRDVTLEKASADDVFALLYTSGTTGNPKGTLIGHKSPIVLSDFMRRFFHITQHDVYATYCSFGFDVCNMDLFLPLTCGASLCIVPQEIKLNLAKVYDYLCRNNTTIVFFPTSIATQYINHMDSGTLRLLLTAGEKLMPLAQTYDNCEIYNCYGPTEAFDFNTFYKVKGDETEIPIGRPNDNTHIYILSESQNRVGVGQIGEICIAGPQVALGYLKQPEQTSKVFTPNPYAGGAYGTLYHTGDLGYIREDGNIIIVGRRDSQVKIRGNRLELKEVEAVVKQFPGVDGVAVDAKTLANGRKVLVAYIVSEHDIDADALCDFIAERKPSYMIPSAVMNIDALPLNHNGKLDRAKLPVPEMLSDKTYVLPRTPIEEKLCEAFAIVLGVEPVGIDDDIVELGGDSLSVMTILDFCRLIPNLTAQILICEGTPRKISERLSSLSVEVSIDAGNVKTDYPTFGMQNEYYELLESVPGNMFLHVEKSLQIGNGVDVERLKAAVGKAIDNHPGLKATFKRNDDGVPRMFRHDDAAPVVSVIKAKEETIETVKNDFMTPFDLANGSLYHIQIVETDMAKYLLMDFHHFVVDGLSIEIFIEDISEAYLANELRPEEWTIFEVAEYETLLLSSSLYDNGKKWYESTFAHLECDKLPAGDVGRDNEATETGRLFIPLGITKKELENAAARQRTTPSILTGAAYAKLMARYTGQDEVLFVTVSNGRDKSQKNLTMGAFSKGEPVYVKTSLPLHEMTSRMNKLRLDCIAHNAFPYSHLSISQRLASGHFFLYQAADAISLNGFCGESAQSFTIKGDEAYFGLLNEIWCDDNAVNLYYSMVYKSNIYSESFARQYIADYTEILKGMM